MLYLEIGPHMESTQLNSTAVSSVLSPNPIKTKCHTVLTNCMWLCLHRTNAKQINKSLESHREDIRISWVESGPARWNTSRTQSKVNKTKKKKNIEINNANNKWPWHESMTERQQQQRLRRRRRKLNHRVTINLTAHPGAKVVQSYQSHCCCW